MRLPGLPFTAGLRRPPIAACPSLPQQQHRSYAKPVAAKGPVKIIARAAFRRKSKKGEGTKPLGFDTTPARVSLARWMLFSHRPLRGLALNPQDSIRHETIHRAWMLFRQRARRAKLARLQALQDSIHRTLMELRATDENLYNIAVSGTRETEKRFPLVMRIPTHTLPLKRWNYSWNRENIKGVGGVATPG